MLGNVCGACACAAVCARSLRFRRNTKDKRSNHCFIYGAKGVLWLRRCPCVHAEEPNRWGGEPGLAGSSPRTRPHPRRCTFTHCTCMGAAHGPLTAAARRGKGINIVQGVLQTTFRSLWCAYCVACCCGWTRLSTRDWSSARRGLKMIAFCRLDCYKCWSWLSRECRKNALT